VVLVQSQTRAYRLYELCNRTKDVHDDHHVIMVINVIHGTRDYLLVMCILL